MVKPNLSQIKNTNILILLQACQKLGIKFEILDLEKHRIRLSKGGKNHLIWEKSMGINSSEGIAIARDKHMTYQFLKKASLPVLDQVTVNSLKEYREKGDQISFPQVIKPVFGQKGINIYLNIKDKKEGLEAVKEYFDFAQAHPDKAPRPGLVVEPYFQGKDFRIMVLNGQVIGFSQRKPPQIKGDGQHTIRELIELENNRRAKDNQKQGQRMLNRMVIWRRINWYLKQQGLKLTDVLTQDKKIVLYPIPNFSTGGTVETIDLDKVNPGFMELALKVSESVGLNLVGIDILVKDLKRKVLAGNCVVVEVNSDPGLRLHQWPNKGKPQLVAEKILEYIFN